MSYDAEQKRRHMVLIENEAKKRREYCKDKTFKLIGVLNLFSIVPDFVVPIFECEQDGKKYAQDLDSFFDITQYRDMQKTIYLEKITNINDFSESIFTIYSRSPFAFQLSDSDYFIGYAEDLAKFLKGFSTDEEILKKSIAEFLLYHANSHQ